QPMVERQRLSLRVPGDDFERGSVVGYGGEVLRAEPFRTRYVEPGAGGEVLVLLRRCAPSGPPRQIARTDEKDVAAAHFYALRLRGLVEQFRADRETRLERVDAEMR